MPILSFVNGPREGERVTVGTEAVLGRGPAVDLDLGDPTVSRRHAQLLTGGARCAVEDLRSGNGTFVNGVRIEGPHPLSQGDELQLGGTRLRFEEEEGAPLSDRTGACKLEIAEEEPDLERSLVVPLRGHRELLGPLAPEVEKELLRERLRIVQDATETMARSVDEAELLPPILEKILDAFPHADRAFVVLGDVVRERPELAAARTRSGQAEEIRVSRTLLSETLARRQAILSVDAGADPDLGSHTVRQIGIRSVICVPLLAGNELFGVLQVDAIGRGRPFTGIDLSVMASLGAAVALGLAGVRWHREHLQAQLAERDLALARQIQRRFLVDPPEGIPGFHFAAEYSPAQQVGGDLYAFLPLPRQRLGVALGDVSGKGVSGALLMSRLVSDLRYLAARGADPETVLGKLNVSVHSSVADEGVFATLLYLCLDLTTGAVEIASAGHDAPLRKAGDGTASELSMPRGPALGLQRDARFPTCRTTLDPGQGLLLFSDGLVEAASPAGDRYGIGRLVDRLGRVPAGHEDLLGDLIDDAAGFAGERGFEDDLTAAWLYRRPD